jgi:hypothetical protein
MPLVFAEPADRDLDQHPRSANAQLVADFWNEFDEWRPR